MTTDKIEIDNTFDTVLTVAIDCNPNQEVRKNHYDIRNIPINSINLLKNEERLSFF